MRLSGFADAGCVSAHNNYVCGNTINESCTINETLTATGTCFTIGEDNITIDGNGYRITGNTSGNGIYAYRITNVAIKNFNIYNFSTGILLASSSNNNLTNNTANNNNAGIYIFNNSNFNNISKNTILNNINAGITLSNCNSWGSCYEGNKNNTLQENEISNNRIGIYSQNSNSAINSNLVCGNINIDFNSSDWLSSSGSSNTCSNSDGWNDTWHVGCSRICNELFLDDLEFKTFLFFYENTDERGFTIESTSWPVGSIASSGFYLTSIPIAIERGWISYEDGYKRVNATLNSYYNDPDKPDDFYVESRQGFFAHWFDKKTGKWNGVDCFSSIDTAILMAGVLTVRQYFAGTEIENVSTKLYENVDWDWMLNGSDILSMGWRPDTGFLQARWQGYNEGMLAVLLAMGSYTHSIPNESWDAWIRTYLYANYKYRNQSYNFVESSSTSLFTYQYPHIWFDFKGKWDKNGTNYFQNSVNATLENMAYCIENPNNHTGYGPNVWGLTASECPLRVYEAHGPRQNDDGTIAPTGAGSSIIFTPDESISALRYMNETYGNKIWGKCGFKDSFNPEIDWYSQIYIGIDQGAILTMAENYRSGLVQSLFMNNEYVKNAMQKAGFTYNDTTPPAIIRVQKENNTITARIIDNTNVSYVFLRCNNCGNNLGITMSPYGQTYSANVSYDATGYYIEANDTSGNIATSRLFNPFEIPNLPSENEGIKVALPHDAPNGSLLVERFDDCMARSITGVWCSENLTSGDCQSTFVSSENHGEDDYLSNSMKIKYNVTKPRTYVVAYVEFDNLNLRHYKEIVFWAKKEEHNTTFKVELKSPGEPIKLVSHIVENLSESWKRIVVPLNEFNKPTGSPGIEWNNVTQFTIIFDNGIFGDEGTLYIDDIYFTPLEDNRICNCGSCVDCTNALNDLNFCDKIKLTANLTYQTGTCINDPENFNNKIFDCQGHVIDGDALEYDYGIYLNNKTNNTIRNCIVTRFEYGIYLNNSSSINIKGNIINSNNYAGINLMESYKNTICNNTILGNIGEITKENSNIYFGNFTTKIILNKSIAGWRYYNIGDCGDSCDPEQVNCSKPANWTQKSFNDSSWTENSTPDEKWECDNCMRLYRYNFTFDPNLLQNENSAIYISSDDGVRCYLNGNLINIDSRCHGKEYWNNVWHVDSDYFENENILACEVKERAGGEFFDAELQIGKTHAGVGISMMSSNNNEILGNTISSNHGYGVLLYPSLNNTLQENEISNNSIGIYSQNSDSTINSNFVCGNTNLDFSSSDWLSSFGVNNTCDKPDVWNDTVKTGCSIKCAKITPGDSNGDGAINIFDVIWAEKIAVGLQGPAVGNADANCDGAVNIFDVIWIEKIAVGLPEPSTC